MILGNGAEENQPQRGRARERRAARSPAAAEAPPTPASRACPPAPRAVPPRAAAPRAAPKPSPARPAPARARQKLRRSRLPAACAPTAYPTSQTRKAGGGFLFHTGAGVDPSSPAFKAAQAKCKKFLPPGPGSGSPPSAKTLAHYLTVARCMRQHGVPEFPDPRTTAPSNPRAALGSGGGVISDIEGVIFVFPGRSISSRRRSHGRRRRARFRCTTTDVPLSKFLASSQPILRSYLA